MRNILAGTFIPIIPFLIAGCGSVPKLMLQVNTEPTGAQVFLKRMGERVTRGGVGSLSVSSKSKKVEEDFLLIGTAPVSYAFPLEAILEGIGLGDIGVHKIIRYTSGVLQIKKTGYKTHESLVSFTGSSITLNLTLQANSGP